MNCVEARGALAVADLHDLTTGADDLAAHLRDCADCRACADSIVAQTSLLAVHVLRRARRRRTRLFMLAAGVPVAAAAVFTVAFREGRGAPQTATAARSATALPVARHVSVTVSRGQSAAVLATADTTVTVVWITGAGQ